MNKLTINASINERGYNAPSVDIQNVEVERGFEVSMPGITVTPWESDNDSITL